MATVKDLLAELKVESQAATDRVQADVASLKAKLAALQAQVDSGEATPEVMQQINDVIAQIKGIDPADATVLPNPDVPAQG